MNRHGSIVVGSSIAAANYYSLGGPRDAFIAEFHAKITMPIIDITLLEGRTHEQKSALITEVTGAAVRTLGAPPQTVRVIIREVEPPHFAVAGVPKGPPKPDTV